MAERLITTRRWAILASVDESPAPPSIAKLDHFGISVTDLTRSLDFYCEVLGAIVLVQPHDVDEFGFRRAIVMIDGPMVLDLNRHGTNSGGGFKPSRTGLDHLAFSAPSYEALEAWAARLDANGVTHSPIRPVEGVGETFDFRDPDDIQLEFWHMDWIGPWASFVQRKLARLQSDVRAGPTS